MSGKPDPTDREAQIQQVIHDYLDRRSQGQEISPTELAEQHPELAPDLARQLQLAEIVKAARQKAVSSPTSETPRENEQGSTKGNSQNGQLPIPGQDGTAGFVGRFELVERLGQGGFATVWKAHDPHLDRWVALKIPKHADLSPSEAELFLREARAASQVSHPNVVRLHEVGRDGERLYLVSDLIEGESLQGWLENRKLTFRQVAELCQKIAEALQAIHDAGIVHRDLKPSNILIDERGEPFITDFGLAKRGGVEATLTLEGQMMGTPAYMSPEQARGESREVTTASDIYSLGIILFELLTEELPFRGPSHVMLSKTIRDEPPSPRTLNPTIPLDLDTICLRCLEKEPGQRFTAATQLANELGRYVRGEPIHSRPIGSIRRTLRWCRRHPVPTALIATLCVVAVVAPLLALRFRDLANEALAAQANAETTEREKSEMLYVSQMNAVQLAMEKGDTLRAVQLLDGQIPEASEPDLRDFEWYYWKAQLKRGLVWEQGPFEPLESVTVSHDSQWVAWGGEGGAVTLRHLETEESYAIPQEFGEEGKVKTIFSLAFSPNENLLAIGRHDQQVSLWNVDERREVLTLSTQGNGIRALTFSDDGQTLAAGTLSGSIELWTDLKPDSHHVIQFTPHMIRSLDLSSDAKKLVAMTHEISKRITGLHYLEVPSGKILASWEEENLKVGICAKFSPDDKYVLYDIDGGSSLEKLDSETLAPQESINFSTKSSPGAIAISSDGKRLFVGSRRGELNAWNLETEQEETWPGHLDHVMEIAVVEDGTQMISGSMDGWVRCWEVGANQKKEIMEVSFQYGYQIWFSKDSKRIYISYYKKSKGFIACWDIDQQQQLWEVETLRPGGMSCTMSPDGQILISGQMDGRVDFRNAQTGQLLEQTTYHRPDRQVSSAKVSPNGRYLATAASQLGDPPFTDHFTEEILVWDYAKRQVMHRWFAHGRKILPLLFGPGEDQLISYGWDKRIRHWRISTQELLAEIECGPKVIRSMYLLADNDTLVAIDANGTVWRWSLATNQLLGKLTQREGAAFCAALSPAGHTLAITLGARKVGETNQEGVIKIIDTRTWEPKCVLKIGNVTPVNVAFSPNGEYLAAGDYDGRILLWHAPRGEEP